MNPNLHLPVAIVVTLLAPLATTERVEAADSRRANIL